MKVKVCRLPRIRLRGLVPWLAIFWTLLVLFAVIWSLVLEDEQAVPVFSGESTRKSEPADMVSRIGTAVLRFTIPTLNIDRKEGFTFGGLTLDRIVHLAVNIHPVDPQTFLNAEIPFMQLIDAAAVYPDGQERPAGEWDSSRRNSREEPPPEETPSSDEFVVPAELKDKPLVAIYHSHTSESYVPTSGRTHVYDNPEVTVVRVGEELARHLSEAGVQVIHAKTVHDYPDYSSSYLNSLNTITNILAENPTIRVVLDIHRDASRREEIVYKEGEQTSARVYLVVGSDEEFSHPNWMANYRFAVRLQRQLETDYPGLSRGIHYARWRYNQHVHPNALLIEIGSHESSLDECLRTTKYLAEVLLKVMADLPEQ